MKDHYLSISQRKRILALFLAVTMLWTMGLGDVVGVVTTGLPALLYGDASGDASGDAMIGQIKSNEIKDFYVAAGKTTYVQFIPEVSGTYVIESLDERGWIDGVLTDASKNTLTEASYGFDDNFIITYELEAGEVYFIKLSFSSNEREGNILISLWQKIPLTWKVENNVLTISGIDTMGNYWVDEATQHTTAPWGNEKFTKVVIEDGVKNISSYAFAGCAGLTSVEIPESVTEICFYAFLRCTNLTSVDIPKSVEKIGSDVFLNCSNLKTITVSEDNKTYASYDGMLFNADLTELLLCPEGKKGSVILPLSATEIGNGAFINCVGVTGVEIPVGMKVIGDAAFYGCSGLENIEIPSGVTEIGQCVFKECTGLKSVEISDGVEEFGWGVFMGCTGLSSAKIPSGVTELSETFRDCISLTSVEIPSSVTIIGKFTFYNCTRLTEFEISADVTYFDASAVTGCTSLVNIDVSEENKAYKSVNGVVTSKDGTELVAYPAGRTGAVKIPSGITCIGCDAFYGNSGITRVEIPESLEIINGGAFGYCTSLQTVIFDSYPAFSSRHSEIECLPFEGDSATAYYDPADGWDEEEIDSYEIYSGLTFVAHAEHIPDTAVAENEQAATCTVAGSYDEVVYCSVCGEEISRTTVPVAAIGHSYGTPAFERQENECVAVFTCEHDDSHTEIINCTVTSEVTTEATTLREGVRTYTATVEKEGNTYTHTWTESIEKLTLAESVSQTISKAVNRVTTAISNVTSRISSALKSLFRFGG